MANWAEGTMKIRGKRTDVLNFLRTGLQAVDWNGNNTGLTVEYDENDDDYATSLVVGKGTYEIYIVGTRRAFIAKDSDEFYLDNGKSSIVEFDFKQGWAVIPENFIELSRTYDIDFHIFTFEMGYEFTQEVEIVYGKLTKDIALKYDNYEWEVSFSKLGG